MSILYPPVNLKPGSSDSLWNGLQKKNAKALLIISHTIMGV